MKLLKKFSKKTFILVGLIVASGIIIPTSIILWNKEVKAQAQSKKDKESINNVKKSIETMIGLKRNPSNSASVVTTPLTFDQSALKKLTIDGQFPTNIEGTTLKYTHQGFENLKTVSDFAPGYESRNFFMHQADDGSIYVGSMFDGIKKLVNGKLENLNTIEVSNGFMYQTKDGTIYVGTRKKGLKKLVNDKLETVDTTDVYNGFMYQTNDGTIYVGTWYKGGIKKLVNGKLEDAFNKKIWQATNEDKNNFMYQTKDGTIYVGTVGDGLFKIVNGKLELVTNIEVGGGFMYQTKDGTIYVGTWGDGLKKLVEEKLKHIDDRDVGKGYMFQAKDGTIYYQTFWRGIKKLNSIVKVEITKGNQKDIANFGIFL